MTKIAIVGADGRMGRRLVALATESDELTVVAAIDSPKSPNIGKDSGEIAGISSINVPLTSSLADAIKSAKPDAVIDFSVLAVLPNTVATCRSTGTPLIIGTTGISEADDTLITEAGKDIPIIWASNFSLVVNVMNLLSAKAAQLLGPAYDIEIIEAHHRFKKDAPSGTAITLAKNICEAVDHHDFDRDVIFSRHGDDCTRKPNEITVQAVRIGDHPGEHTAYFAALGERLEIKHISTTRDSYVSGALKSAPWLTSQPNGRYNMKDVLGLDI